MTPDPISRVEHDPLGEHTVPSDAYYGIQTVRATENFPISGLHAPADLVTATVLIKRAAARANVELGRLDARVGEAIIKSADEILNGALRDQFIVDIYQAGAGTSHNMNVNEVLANRASELLGGAEGRVPPGAPQRSRQHGTVHQRRVPVSDASRPPARTRRPGRRRTCAGGILAPEGRSSSLTSSKSAARICRMPCR